MNIARLNGWTVRYIMWGISYRTLTAMLDSVKPAGSDNGSSKPGQGYNIEAPARPESIQKLALLGITVKDFTK